MLGTLSFHPVDLQLFDELIQPLLAGKKVNPESYLEAAKQLRVAAWTAASYTRTLHLLLDELEPPPPPTEGNLWDKVRARLERFDYRPDRASLIAAKRIDPDLHLEGRPFFITEGSADRVATLVDEYRNISGEAAAQSLVLEQLVRLDPELGKCVKQDEFLERLTPDMTFRRELLDSLTQLSELAEAARSGDMFGHAGTQRRPAVEVLVEELPWRVMTVHAQVVPFWSARDVDGLETICEASGVPAPDCLVPAWRLVGDLCGEFQALRDSMGTRLARARDVAAFVSPSDMPCLLEFLSSVGSRIIQAATRHGEGKTCATLLRKIRECATYAERHGMGFIEASGVAAPVPLPRDEEALAVAG